nr:unnamed protein product [Naegleria fowleri]
MKRSSKQFRSTTTTTTSNGRNGNTTSTTNKRTSNSSGQSSKPHLKSKLENILASRKKRKTIQEDDDEIHSDVEEDFEVSPEQLLKHKDDEEEEHRIRDASEVAPQQEDEEELTAAEKRVLNAKQFLENLKVYEEDKEEEEEFKRMMDGEDPIAQALKREALKAKKQIPSMYHEYLEEIDFTEPSRVTFLKGHKKTPTCIVLNNSGSSSSNSPLRAFTGAKDGCIIHWDLTTQKKISITKKAHDNCEILCCALSFDGSILATGGRDNKIRLWDTRTMKPIDVFEGHFKPVTCLAFQMGHQANVNASSNNSSYAFQLYSGSLDRTIKVWDARDLTFIDTLYGHESEVQGIDTMITPHAVSCGSDASLRYWKVEDETQLIFKNSASKYSVDCVKMLRENTYVSGSQDGSVSMWIKTKKKPIVHFENAHGGEWISSVGALRFSDVVATGSCDGYLKLWRCDPNAKILQLKNNIPLQGFVNGIDFSSNGQFLTACIGQEHRLGRWFKKKESTTTSSNHALTTVKNGIALVKLLSDEMLMQDKHEGNGESKRRNGSIFNNEDVLAHDDEEEEDHDGEHHFFL